jgi:UDP-3-O-acyl-N-acetylglucosamine deacetylase
MITRSSTPWRAWRTGIDNLIIEVDADEIPVGEGRPCGHEHPSQGGVVELDAEKKQYIHVVHPVYYRKDDVT